MNIFEDNSSFIHEHIWRLVLKKMMAPNDKFHFDYEQI